MESSTNENYCPHPKMKPPTSKSTRLLNDNSTLSLKGIIGYLFSLLIGILAVLFSPIIIYPLFTVGLDALAYFGIFYGVVILSMIMAGFWVYVPSYNQSIYKRRGIQLLSGLIGGLAASILIYETNHFFIVSIIHGNPYQIQPLGILWGVPTFFIPSYLVFGVYVVAFANRAEQRLHTRRLNIHSESQGVQGENQDIESSLSYHLDLKMGGLYLAGLVLVVMVYYLGWAVALSSPTFNLGLNFALPVVLWGVTGMSLKGAYRFIELPQHVPKIKDWALRLSVMFVGGLVVVGVLMTLVGISIGGPYIVDNILINIPGFTIWMVGPPYLVIILVEYLQQRKKMS